MQSIYLFGFCIFTVIVTQCTANPIVGGEPVGRVVLFDGKALIVNEKPYPFMVKLNIKESVPKKGEEDYVESCGGTLIGSQTVLTAAHCLYDMESKPQIEVIAGIIQLQYEKNKAQVRRVQKYLMHQKYVDSCNNNDKKRAHYCFNDIALLWVGTPFQFSSTVQPAILASSTSVVQNKVGVILGWGYTETGYDTDMLMKAVQKVIPASVCKKEYDDTIFDSGKLCLISEQKTSVVCFGDSGGPFASNGVVYGLGSFGRKSGKRNLKDDCLPQYPSVYTNVAHYESWIRTSIQNWSLKELKKFVRFEGKQGTGVYFDKNKPTLPPELQSTKIQRPQNNQPVQPTKPTKRPPGKPSKPNIHQPKGKRH